MIPPRTWPEGTERPLHWFERRRDRMVPTTPALPCPEFECGARLWVSVGRFTAVCEAGHQHRAEDLWRRGVRV